MTITPITTDKTATITLSSNNTWVLEQDVNLFPDASVNADAMYGNNVSQTLVQLYGNIVTEFGNAVGFGAGIYLDGTSNTNQIHVQKDASILAGGYGIALNGSNNSVLNAGIIDSYAAFGLSTTGNENVIVNHGNINGFSGAIAVSGTSNFITNYGSMDISSFESDIGTLSTITITSHRWPDQYAGQSWHHRFHRGSDSGW
jgi:hypothetical protein